MTDINKFLGDGNVKTVSCVVGSVSLNGTGTLLTITPSGNQKVVFRAATDETTNTEISVNSVSIYNSDPSLLFGSGANAAAVTQNPNVIVGGFGEEITIDKASAGTQVLYYSYQLMERG